MRRTKPGATEEQANRDSADCLFDAQSVVPGGSQGQNGRRTVYFLGPAV